MLGSRIPWETSLEKFRAILERPQPGADLRRPFERLPSINEELRAAMQAQWESGGGRKTAPLIFSWKAGGTTEGAVAVGEVEGEEGELLTAQALMETGRQREGVDKIESLLEKRGRGSDWSAAFYAALGAKESLKERNTAQARRLLDLGLKWDPSDEQLHYLTRIVNRLDAGTR